MPSLLSLEYSRYILSNDADFSYSSVGALLAFGLTFLHLSLKLFSKSLFSFLRVAVAVPSTYITQVTSKLSTCQVSYCRSSCPVDVPLEPLPVVPFSELARIWQDLQGSPRPKMTM